MSKQLNDGEILQIVLGLQLQRRHLLEMASIAQKYPQAINFAEDMRLSLIAVDSAVEKLILIYRGPWDLRRILSGVGA
jgi:hypothetical protein